MLSAKTTIVRSKLIHFLLVTYQTMVAQEIQTIKLVIKMENKKIKQTKVTNKKTKTKMMETK